jgi:hypothetical protein
MRVRYLFRDELAATTVRGGIRRLIIPWLVVWRVLMRDGGDCDIVEIHEPLAAAYSLLRRCRRLRIPKCMVVSYGTEERCWRAQRQRWHFLGVSHLKSRLLVPPTLLWQSRFGLRNSDHVMVPNDTDEQYVRDELGVPGERVTQVNTGVGDEFFAVPRNDERAFAALSSLARGSIERARESCHSRGPSSPPPSRMSRSRSWELAGPRSKCVSPLRVVSRTGFEFGRLSPRMTS